MIEKHADQLCIVSGIHYAKICFDQVLFRLVIIFVNIVTQKIISRLGWVLGLRVLLWVAWHWVQNFRRTDSGHKDWVDGVLLQAQTNFGVGAGEL